MEVQSYMRPNGTPSACPARTRIAHQAHHASYACIMNIHLICNRDRLIFDHVMADVHARACLTPGPHRGVSPELAHTTWPPERKRGGAPIPRRARPVPSESE